MTTGLNGSEHLVMRDYWKTVDDIARIIINPKHNYLVVENSYSQPKMVNTKVPLEDDSGAFMFFRKKADALREAITTGYISASNLPRDAPNYICELVR